MGETAREEAKDIARQFWLEAADRRLLVSKITSALTAREARGRAEGIEEAAKVVDREGTGNGSDNADWVLTDPAMSSLVSRRQYADSLAAAIRSLPTQGETK